MYNNGKDIKFEIVTPERVVLKKMIRQVTVPTKMGIITVLPKHMPLVASLMPGVIELKDNEGFWDIISVSGGFIEVLRNKVIILADTAERAEEIDLDRAEEARKRAEETVKGLKRADNESFAGTSAMIAKQLARTSAVQKWRKIRR
jgi:F-type H+-transporting ATPase subunit epsilon